jgi:hypothetical protein
MLEQFITKISNRLFQIGKAPSTTHVLHRFRPTLELCADRSAPSTLSDPTGLTDPSNLGITPLGLAPLEGFVNPSTLEMREGGTAPIYAAATTTVATGVGGVTISPNGTNPSTRYDDIPQTQSGQVISGPGRITYPEGSIGIVTDRTMPGDAALIRGVAPNIELTERAATWMDVALAVSHHFIGDVPPISAIVISGHGNLAGGVASTAGGLLASNLDEYTIGVIQIYTAPGTPIIIVGCACGRLDAMQEIANATGRPVIANSSSVTDGNLGLGNWLRFDPFVGPPAPR